MISVQDVRDGLNQYQGLEDKKIEQAIEFAETQLDGINPDWRTITNQNGELIRDKVHLLQAIGITLKLHFPESTAGDSYNQMAAEQVTSSWSSSFMIRKKTYGFAVRGRPQSEIDNEDSLI